MALRYLIASGSVADPTKWDGGVSVPGSGDDCYANGFTGTISANFTVNSLNTTASGPAAAGGGFTCTTAVTITCSGGFFAGSTNCLTLTGFGTAIGPSYGSSTTGSRIGVSISGAASHMGDSHGGSFASAYGTSASTGAVHYGDSYAGSSSNANGTNLSGGGLQYGHSYGGATGGAYGTLVNGGTQVGDSHGGTGGTTYGSRVTSGGFHYGKCYGGTSGTAYGTYVENGGVAIPTQIITSTAPGLNVANDGAVILQGTATLAQVNITASAGRYRIDRGVSSVRPFIRPPIFPAFAS